MRGFGSALGFGTAPAQAKATLARTQKAVAKEAIGGSLGRLKRAARSFGRRSLDPKPDTGGVPCPSACLRPTGVPSAKRDCSARRPRALGRRRDPARVLAALRQPRVPCPAGLWVKRSSPLRACPFGESADNTRTRPCAACSPAEPGCSSVLPSPRLRDARWRVQVRTRKAGHRAGQSLASPSPSASASGSSNNCLQGGLAMPCAGRALWFRAGHWLQPEAPAGHARATAVTQSQAGLGCASTWFPRSPKPGC